MKRSKAQLNAISRSITRRNQEQAITELAAMGIDFTQYQKDHGWKGSPVLLARLIREGKRS